MANVRQQQASARRLARQAARTARDRHSTDIVVLDLRGISPVTDYFVIFTGTSDRQMRAVADEILELGAKSGQAAMNVSGMNSAKWILLDFFDVVVHIFDDEYRKYYDLELIWGDAPRLNWQRSSRRASGPGEGEEDES